MFVTDQCSPGVLLTPEQVKLYLLQRLVLGADVEADASPFDGERVHAVVLHQHLSVTWRPQLDKGLKDTQRPSVSISDWCFFRSLMKVIS